MALQGDVGCRAIFGNHLNEIRKVEVDDIGVLLDIDSKEDYERLRYFGPGQEQKALVEATREPREMPGQSSTPPRSRAGLISVGWNWVIRERQNRTKGYRFTSVS